MQQIRYRDAPVPVEQVVEKLVQVPAQQFVQLVEKRIPVPAHHTVAQAVEVPVTGEMQAVVEEKDIPVTVPHIVEQLPNPGSEVSVRASLKRPADVLQAPIAPPREAPAAVDKPKDQPPPPSCLLSPLLSPHCPPITCGGGMLVR